MNRLDKVKKVIKEHIEEADCGLFFVPNWCGDPMETITVVDGVTIDICYYYSYFEVFGLNKEEQDELLKYYEELRN